MAKSKEELNALVEEIKALQSKLSELSEEALSLIREADVILSKGQGNFETMLGCGLNVYYVFLCKCQFFVELFGVEQMTGMFINERRIKMP